MACNLAGVLLCRSDYAFFFQAEDGIRDDLVTGVQTCALPISLPGNQRNWPPSASARTLPLPTVTEYSLPPSPPSSRELPKAESPVASRPTFRARSLVSRLYKPPKVQSAAPAFA